MLENSKYYNFQNKYKLSKTNFDVGHPRYTYQWPMTQFKLIKLKICQQAPIEADVMINFFCTICTIGCLVSNTNYKIQLLALEHCSIFWHLFSFSDFNVFFTTTFFYSLFDSELNPIHYPIIMHVLLTMLLTRKFRFKNTNSQKITKS
jgi:hypothetical protein